MHVWMRSAWCAEADAALGPLIAHGRAEMLRLIELGLLHGGHAQLFHVTGPDYGGWFLIRFADGPDGIECDCVAFAGRDTESGLPDLARMAKQAGAVALTSADSAKVGGAVTVQGTVVTAPEASGAVDDSTLFFVSAGISVFRTAESRKFLLLQNIGSSGNIFVRFGGMEPSAISGIRLAPGQSVTFDGRWVPQDSFKAISDSAMCVLYFMRGT